MHKTILENTTDVYLFCLIVSYQILCVVLYCILVIQSWSTDELLRLDVWYTETLTGPAQHSTNKSTLFEQFSFHHMTYFTVLTFRTLFFLFQRKLWLRRVLGAHAQVSDYFQIGAGNCRLFLFTVLTVKEMWGNCHLPNVLIITNINRFQP